MAYSISEVNNEKLEKSENNEILKNVKNGNLLELQKELQILQNQISKIQNLIER